jgi:anhydro-N-acetylmuramic acid kinase
MLINEKSPVIKAIGLMSGTSLDGVDLAFCTFSLVDERWTFTTEAAETYSYTDEWLEILKNLHLQSASKIFEVDAALGRYYGELIKKFIKKNNLHPDLIASHGHTLFHQPEKGFTTQIGSGAHISAITGLSTICDFRSKDVALGGQGAPLVPVGDHYLFSDYAACLNLGGIANISMVSEDGRRVAYDICPVNMALNALAQRVGKPFDEDGLLARSGTILPELLNRLNALPFYQQKGAKSLPEKELIMFKEAIVFAFLGALNYWGRVNVFDSATGSVKQHVGGAMYRGFDFKGSILRVLPLGTAFFAFSALGLAVFFWDFHFLIRKN